MPQGLDAAAGDGLQWRAATADCCGVAEGGWNTAGFGDGKAPPISNAFPRDSVTAMTTEGGHHVTVKLLLWFWRYANIEVLFVVPEGDVLQREVVRGEMVGVGGGVEDRGIRGRVPPGKCKVDTYIEVLYRAVLDNDFLVAFSVNDIDAEPSGVL